MSFNFNTKDECIATHTGSGLEEKKTFILRTSTMKLKHADMKWKFFIRKRVVINQSAIKRYRNLMPGNIVPVPYRISTQDLKVLSSEMDRAPKGTRLSARCRFIGPKKLSISGLNPIPLALVMSLHASKTLRKGPYKT